MLPEFAMDNIANHCWRYIELFRNAALYCTGSISFAYGDYLLVGEFGRSNGFAFCLTIFAHFVGNVFGGSSSEQVRPITAKWIISIGAVMTHVLTFWNRAIMQFIGITMRRGTNVVMAEQAVRPASSPCPYPAFIGTAFDDLRPKGFFLRMIERFAGVPIYVPARLSFDDSAFKVCCFGDWYSLPTTAHAEPAGVWPISWRSGFSWAMSFQESVGFIFFYIDAMEVAIRYRSFLPATTLAFAIGRKQSGFSNPGCIVLQVVREVYGFIKRELGLNQTWGMLHDVISSFQLLTTPRDDSTHRLGNSIGFYSFILPQVSA